eukprot:TRINITY_DN121465_c0_g1_i1.p1 TRINITY_DN121465_c0_g1~~TRINITY_DN121465_c0_g1_i1.p1  ORF type:complete len:171 (-),score=24.42 TRINITY_DN121465_c0_g1_i1:27-539(-)
MRGWSVAFLDTSAGVTPGNILSPEGIGSTETLEDSADVADANREFLGMEPPREQLPQHIASLTAQLGQKAYLASASAAGAKAVAQEASDAARSSALDALTERHKAEELLRLVDEAATSAQQQFLGYGVLPSAGDGVVPSTRSIDTVTLLLACYSRPCGCLSRKSAQRAFL